MHLEHPSSPLSLLQRENLVNMFGIPSHPRKACNKLWILDAATGQG